jgi:hypothetical protein
VQERDLFAAASRIRRHPTDLAKRDVHAIPRSTSGFLSLRRWWRFVIDFREQFPHRRAESLSDLFGDENGGHSHAAFEHRNVCSMKPGSCGQSFLCDTGCFTSASKHDPKQFR